MDAITEKAAGYVFLITMLLLFFLLWRREKFLRGEKWK